MTTREMAEQLVRDALEAAVRRARNLKQEHQDNLLRKQYEQLGKYLVTEVDFVGGQMISLAALLIVKAEARFLDRTERLKAEEGGDS
jgi:hypothetical protein